MSVPALDRQPSQSTLKFRRITTQDGKVIVGPTATGAAGPAPSTSTLSQRRSTQVVVGPAMTHGQRIEAAGARLQLWDRDRPTTPKQPAGQLAGRKPEQLQPWAGTLSGGGEREGRATFNANVLVMPGEPGPARSLETTA